MPEYIQYYWQLFGSVTLGFAYVLWVTVSTAGWVGAMRCARWVLAGVWSGGVLGGR